MKRKSNKKVRKKLYYLLTKQPPVNFKAVKFSNLSTFFIKFVFNFQLIYTFFILNFLKI